VGDLYPDPKSEIRMTTLHATRGANYWSRLPVTRMDLEIGAYENISSADVPGFTASLVTAMPGLRDHRCSIGEPGGFLIRLKRGTYCAHIVEHVALELQGIIGHEVGYGRTRGGEKAGDYTLIFEHRHEAVGLRAGALALEIVQNAFAGKLGSINYAVAELRALADTSDMPALIQHVFCGITGGSHRTETRSEMVRLGFGAGDLIVDVSPSYILQAGLPYSHSDIAIILDSDLNDVPQYYRLPRRADRLVAVVADAVPEGGIVIVPAKKWEIQDLVRDAGCRVAIFAADDDVTTKDKKVARASAMVVGRRIIIEEFDKSFEAGWVHDKTPIDAQVVATLAAFSLNKLRSDDSHDDERENGDRSRARDRDRAGVAD
jgi:cyanophycin synthetase